MLDTAKNHDTAITGVELRHCTCTHQHHKGLTAVLPRPMPNPTSCVSATQLWRKAFDSLSCCCWPMKSDYKNGPFWLRESQYSFRSWSVIVFRFICVWGHLCRAWSSMRVTLTVTEMRPLVYRDTLRQGWDQTDVMHWHSGNPQRSSWRVPTVSATIYLVRVRIWNMGIHYQSQDWGLWIET